MPNVTTPHTRLSNVAPRSERPCKLLKWEPWPFDNASLIGHCSVAFAGGWCIHNVPVFRGRDGISVGTPSSAQIDQGGHVKERDGKRLYIPVITFEHAEGRERWRRMVLGALADAGIGGAP
jgi:hypothetical protein